MLLREQAMDGPHFNAFGQPSLDQPGIRRHRGNRTGRWHRFAQRGDQIGGTGKRCLWIEKAVLLGQFVIATYGRSVIAQRRRDGPLGLPFAEPVDNVDDLLHV